MLGTGEGTAGEVVMPFGRPFGGIDADYGELRCRCSFCYMPQILAALSRLARDLQPLRAMESA